MNNYTLLIEKLDAFIRKFYINQLLRGSLYAVGTILGLFILFNVLEYYFYFNTSVRKLLFYGFLGASALALYQWVVVPLMHYFRLGKIIDHEQAARIIGDHFGNVQDKLLNILQLKKQGGNALYADLITASINQKSDEIRLVPFQKAIDLGKNRKYLKYALPPVLLLLFLLVGAPNILKEGTKRLINNNQEFERPAPFAFKVNAEDLEVLQFEDFQLKVEVEGEALPNEVFIDLGGKVQYRLNKENANTFSYTFANVQKNTEFNLFSSGVESKDYTLSVLAKPGILSFDVKLDYPDYTGRADERIANIGDLVVPVGTRLRWVFDAQHTDDFLVKFGNAAPSSATQTSKQSFAFDRRLMKDETYKVFIKNQNTPFGDSVGYALSVIPDLAPEINVEEFKDSTMEKVLFFVGDASDDYGMSNLTFNYQIKKSDGGQQPVQAIKLARPTGKQVQYDYTFDLRQLDLKAGDEVSYYFEVTDNDAVNGPKSSRTGVQTFRLPSVEELEKLAAQNAEEIKDDLKKALEESNKLKEELRKLREKALQQKELDWQTKKEMEKLLNRQKQINEFMQQAQQNFEENKKNNEELNKQSEQLQQKEEQLEKLFEEAIDPETQKLMEEIQKLLEEMNKDEALDKMEKMDEKNQEMNKELERLEELYKQMEVENMMEQQSEKLEELAEKLEELAEKTEEQAKKQEQNPNLDDKAKQEELKKEQENINKEFDDLMKKQKEMEEKNEQLKRPKDIPKMDEEMDETEQELNQAEQNLEQKENKPASKNQKKAAQKMKNMSGQMKSGAAGGEMKQIEEDLETLRQILENLVGLSFNQESNMKEVTGTTANTPRYTELVQEQFKIKDDFKIVEDSLHALAMRNASIEGVVTEKVADVKNAIKHSLDELEERKKPQAAEQQQRSMKGMNDLALLLSDAMQNMQQQMSSMMEGSQQCQKPGSGKGKKGKVPMDKITKGQKELGEQMKEGMQKKKDGQQKPGGKDGKGGMSSEEFAKMAAKQAALRQAIQELQKAKMEQGKGSQTLEKLIEEMNKVEVDLVNKRLTNEMMKRQEEILTRLLEEERAEREREQDEKRQAESAQQQPAKMPPALEEYLKKRQAETELYKTVSPALKPFYKRLVEDYWKANQ